MKVFVHYELVHIDLQKNVFRFYNITLTKINKQTLQLVSRSGKLGNKGKTSVLMEVENDDIHLKEVLSKAKNQMRLKKKEGFSFKSDIEKKLSFTKSKEYNCHNCKDTIEKELYEKIDDWARKEGGWDKRKGCSGYKKVLCIPCQIDKGLYKKRLG